LLPAERIVSALTRAGFEAVSQKGSHLKLKRDGRSVIVPMHQEVARGTLKSVLEQAGVDLERFMELL
jgi:predicted RNA binding protein YcfA (HicA-like mRNA interferase family)